ncbi:MAG: SAM-dependent methyltransferase [Spirochaetia bacterium]|nr:SAM-dependent methyltransferase [Spirochaetia bacterium]
MAKNTDEKLSIQEAIKAFSKENISNAGINLFSVLGYDTSLQAPLDKKTYAEFKENYIDTSPSSDRFSEEKALVSDWKSIDILFQLTDDSFSNQPQLFDSTFNKLNPQSYLCFAIELNKEEYSKSQIANITREINKLFSIPIIIIFKYAKSLTLSVINRRVNKRDNERDVLEKVTLIKDIFYEKPHRAHIEILFDMSLAQLSTEYTIYNFETLHKAWSKVLDTQTLNKRFYTELSNWYFWAIKTVVYPGYEMEAEKNSLFTKEDKLREHNAKNLIRLLTRLLFVWFIKEKDLIPEELFDEKTINDLITSFEPDKYYSSDAINKESKSIYYKAILQNLFFASLNAEQGKRAFRLDGQNQNATSLMRYQKFHKNPNNFVELIESKVPFMNGGLFECLDSQDDEKKGKKGGAIINYEDGFSDRKDNELFVPDYIFFGKDVKVDLSSEYDDRRKKDVTVNGIINILQKYKFTIAENTPVEEDIALDPELLGRVFENLLASYNPETKTNARKQTGSFYTPRPIVEYMVDESLKAYLKTKIKDAALSKGSLEEITKSVEEIENNLDSKLDNLIAYNESEPDFSDEERFQILKYIDECKILDPACGSGAFPMGILQKMVYVIHKLDPQNDNWKQIQIQKISNDANLTPKEKNELQSELLTVFDDNELDYARKLYLIENCIHGIDIQPIATQISRLRFFISLIVDQKVDEKKPNFGVRPLPNLENRFVTANSLIGLDNQTGYLAENEIIDLKKELSTVRHKLFNAKSPSYKFELKQKDKEIRKKMEQALLDSGFGKENASMISTWDPYDKNRSAEFFDAEWMFGIKDGFDIVIGNPPYVESRNSSFSEELKDSLQKQIQSNYGQEERKCFPRGADLLIFFETVKVFL